MCTLLQRITASHVMSWGDTYHQVFMSRMFAAPGRTPLEVAAEEQIAIWTRLWLLLRPEVIPEKKLWKLGLKFVEQTEPTTQIVIASCNVFRRWLKGRCSDARLNSQHRAVQEYVSSRQVQASRPDEDVLAVMHLTTGDCNAVRACAQALVDPLAPLQLHGTKGQQWRLKQVVRQLRKLEGKSRGE